LESAQHRVQLTPELTTKAADYYGLNLCSNKALRRRAATICWADPTVQGPALFSFKCNFTFHTIHGISTSRRFPSIRDSGRSARAPLTTAQPVNQNFPRDLRVAQFGTNICSRRDRRTIPPTPCLAGSCRQVRSVQIPREGFPPSSE